MALLRLRVFFSIEPIVITPLFFDFRFLLVLWFLIGLFYV